MGQIRTDANTHTRCPHVINASQPLAHFPSTHPPLPNRSPHPHHRCPHVTLAFSPHSQPPPSPPMPFPLPFSPPAAPTLTTDALRSLLLSRGLPPTALRNARGGPLHLSPRPLFAALSPEAQLRAFAPAPSHARKAILATNIAETSVTVSGVRYVIDAGLVKSRGYSARMGAESLLVVPVSRAQAVQRSGRAGREAPGVAFRLYTEETFVRELAEVRGWEWGVGGLFE